MINKRLGGFLISKIHQIAGRIFSKKLKSNDINLNSAQGRILFVLWKEDSLPINELARRTSLSKTSLTSMLCRLEELGHIIRKQSDIDKRSTILCLTKKNKALKNKYEKVSMEMTDLFYNGLKEKEIDLFEEYLKRILNNLED